jgi:hypothetical protein
MQERQDWLDNMLKEVNIGVEFYNCKRISMTLLEHIICYLEASGKALEDIDIDDIIEGAFAINPTLKKPINDDLN